MAPVETLIRIEAEQGDVAWDAQFVRREELEGRGEEYRLVHDQSGGRRHLEQGLQAGVEALAAAGMWPVLWAGLAVGLLSAVAACRLLAQTLLHADAQGGDTTHAVPETAVALAASLVCLLAAWWAGPLLQAVRQAAS